MLTPNHGLLAYWFNKFLNQKLKTKVHPAYILTGAILPDVFLIFGFALGVSTLVTVSKGLHSILVFLVAFFCYFLFTLVSQGINYGRVTAFFVGWGLFHIAIDTVTHKTKAWPYFWPWIDSPIHGIVDHGNPVLFAVEGILSIYLLYHLVYWIVKQATPKAP